MKKWLAFVLLPIAGLAAAAAVAAGTPTTGTVSACATAVATAATHTSFMDTTPVATVGGETATNEQCATTTYTVPTVTETDTVTTTTPGTTTPTQAPLDASAGIGVEDYGHLSSIANPNLFHIVIGNASGTDLTVEENAKGLGLAYFDGTDVQTGYSTGVPYADASANGWLLKDSSGNFLINSSYGSYCADVGSTGYQNEWISNVLAFLAAHPGIDGVFNDNTMYDPKADCGAYPAKYPTTATWSAAMLSFVKAAGSALSSHGYYLALNANAYIAGDAGSNDGTNEITWWKELGPYADGLFDEYYDETTNGTDQLRANGTAWYQQFDAWQKLIGTAQSMGDDFLGITYGAAGDTAAMTYAKASFLLEWNGGGSSFMYKVKGSTSDPSDPAWTASIGTPTSAKVAVGVGYMRSYTGGTVLVNPSASASQTFTVNGVSYTLAATTAKILTS